MGRSVSTPSAARVVAYSHLDCEDDTDFDWIVDDFRCELKRRFPSVVTADGWIGCEDHVVARNGNALFGISEYCGLVAYWIVAADEVDAIHRWDGPSRLPLQERWIDSIADKFTKAFGTLTKTGTASNGENFYTRSN